MLKRCFQKEVRNRRASFFILVSTAAFSIYGSIAVAVNSVTATKLEKARELVLKGERTAAIKSLKELTHEIPATSGTPKVKTKVTDASREVAQAWLEIAEVFLTDRGQNQFSLAESIWLTKPKDAIDVLTPLLKLEDGNLQVSRLGARAALRLLDCVRADVFAQQAELAYPLGADVRLLRQQTLDCQNATNASAAAMKLSPENEPAEFEGAFRLLAVKEAIRKKDFKLARVALASWESSKPAAAVENPEFWYWKWRVSTTPASTDVGSTGTPEMHDRAAARRYLRLCSELTPRRRKNFAAYPDLCQATETIESDLKSSDKAGL